MDKGVWKETVKENTHSKVMRPCYRLKERVYAKKGKCISLVQRGKGRSVQVHRRTVEKRLHLTIKVALNGTGILCGKEGQEEKDGTRLLISQ